ncbi:conserved hypothetical protein [Stigmatella aurantiaca DW4/3-1]|uniref:Uncharacterized protein n=1 Tax=Stigmatella aurantiaca (strain DW4/3-1) TaxID=378806 RepID=Q08RV9_STIAD|nr:conserved hypothetical protein [Stigmatella aurantiaca DW4/3-1]
MEGGFWGEQDTLEGCLPGHIREHASRERGVEGPLHGGAHPQLRRLRGRAPAQLVEGFGPRRAPRAGDAQQVQGERAVGELALHRAERAHRGERDLQGFREALGGFFVWRAGLYLHRGQLPQSSEEALLRATGEEQGVPLGPDGERERQPLGGRAHLGGGQLADAPRLIGQARPAHGAQQAERSLRAAHGRAVLHEGLIEVPGPLALHEGTGQGPQPGLPCLVARHAFHREEAGEHARHVAIHQGGFFSEGNGGHGPRRVAAEAGQGEQVLRGGGKPSSEVRDDLLGGAVEVARARVVAKAPPRGEHVIQGGRRQGPHRGKARQEPLPVGNDGGHLGLLQHDLAEPDGVGVARAAPGQIPLLPAIPGQQGGPDGGHPSGIQREDFLGHLGAHLTRLVGRGEGFSPCRVAVWRRERCPRSPHPVLSEQLSHGVCALLGRGEEALGQFRGGVLPAQARLAEHEGCAEHLGGMEGRMLHEERALAGQEALPSAHRLQTRLHPARMQAIGKLVGDDEVLVHVQVIEEGQQPLLPIAELRLGEGRAVGPGEEEGELTEAHPPSVLVRALLQHFDPELPRGEARQGHEPRQEALLELVVAELEGVGQRASLHVVAQPAGHPRGQGH